MATRQAHERRARERAREVHQDYGINSWPVLPDTIARAEKLPVEELAGFPRNTYGALFKAGNSFRIVLSTDCHTEGQRRFTFCHELGHYFLDGHVEALFDGGAEVHMSDMNHFRGNKFWYEVEADAFAAEFLVPSAAARAVLAKASPGLDAVRTIEGTFQTSLSCAAVRFANLTPEPAAIILSRGQVIEWVSWSSSMQEHKWARRRVKGEWAPPRSVTYALSRSPERVLRGELADGEGLLTEWFDGAPAVTVIEEAVGLGAYGRVLTVLTCPELPSPERLDFEQERDRRQGNWREPLRQWTWDSYDDMDDG